MGSTSTARSLLFYQAVCENKFEVARDLLSDPSVDVNFVNPSVSSLTPLHCACEMGHVEMVKLLLAHPKINVNSEKSDSETPFSMAFWKPRIAVIKVMLEDPRVDVNHQRKDGSNGPWFAARDGLNRPMLMLLASGKKINLNVCGDGTDDIVTMFTRSRAHSPVTLSLLKMHRSNPVEAAFLARIELGYPRKAAFLFSMVVFLSDELLCLLPQEKRIDNDRGERACRFFDIASRLPIDLQMVLCNITHNSAKVGILSRHSELAFRILASRCKK